MFINNDSMVIVSAIIVLSVFTYTFYNNIFTTVQYKEVGVQTESLVNTLPNIDSIPELPENSYPSIEPNILHHVDTGVQTSDKALASLFKDWAYKISIDLRVGDWINNLDTSQNSPSQDVISGESESNLQELVEVSDLMYDITNHTDFVNMLREPGVEFTALTETNQYLLTLNDVILSVDPNIVSNFM
jgi:hypothetical protein